MPEFKYEITQNVGVLSESATGWSRQVNYVSWNGRDPKFDIRDWAPDHAKMGKGVTISADEMILLRDLLNELDL